MMRQPELRFRQGWLLTIAACLSLPALARGDVRLPALFTDHLVLQQGQANPLWGWADAGEAVTVAIGDQRHQATAGADGRWRVKLNALPAGGPQTLTVEGKNKLQLQDVLVGEVWVCSGQSNMQWTVGGSNNADLEALAADYPQIRLISVPQVGSQEPKDDFAGQWQVCTPDTVRDFSGVGYFFGRQLHRTLKVPVGLIDNAWGGSACEAWVRRDLFEADPAYQPLLTRWSQMDADYERTKAEHAQQLEAWKAAGSDPARRPAPPREPATNARPANLYNGVLHPVIGYGIRGAIWYQGESNAGRAYQYRDLFPLMIRNWREDWGQGDFPFYWVQLADFMAEPTEPKDSAWAELREAQTMTMDRLPNTGEAVIIDIGEGRDIHPRNKQDVAMRLARWALAKDYGVPVVYQSPRFKSMECQDGKCILTFDQVGGGLYTFDIAEPVGFAVAGEDKAFVWAKARLVDKTKDQIEVWSDSVAKPVAVRYAWADNPVCNLQSREGLPVTPFRTDDWPGVTANNQ